MTTLQTSSRRVTTMDRDVAVVLRDMAFALKMARRVSMEIRNEQKMVQPNIPTSAPACESAIMSAV